MAGRLLVNHFYAQPVGHAIEALHYANGYHAADPELEIAVALNAATPVELASYCPAVRTAWKAREPAGPPGAPRQARSPRTTLQNWGQRRSQLRALFSS